MQYKETSETRDKLRTRVLAMIDACAAGNENLDELETLFLDVARWQAAHVAPYRRLLVARGIEAELVVNSRDLPAVPTDVFRCTRVSAHTSDQDIQLFQTSGTTSGARGQVHLRDLSLYHKAAHAIAGPSLFPDQPDKMRLLSLIPTISEQPTSSLSHMVHCFFEWFGSPDSCYIWRNGSVDAELLAKCLDEAMADGKPVCLLGTSFAFVFADDALGDRHWNLPAHSRIMQTGGFKGRTREYTPDQMRKVLAARYGIPEEYIIAEYGMSELSSQFYETSLREAVSGGSIGPRRFQGPPWARVVLVDPLELRPIEDDGPGLIRIEDLANLDSVWAIQTSDMGRKMADGFEILGRAKGAVLRGCSLTVEEALAGAAAPSAAGE